MPEEIKQPQQQSVQIEIDASTAQGIYTNLALIAHSETEFVLDFIFQSPHPPKAKVCARIITGPLHIKRFIAALQDNLKKYEARFGPIKTSPTPPETKVGFFH